jgi:hypothetical protein
MTRKYRNPFAQLTIAACFLLGGTNLAHSAELSFLICQPGGPDLKEQEQAVIRDFYNYIGERLDFKPGAIQGSYETQRKKCLKALEKKPAVLMLSLDMFLTARQNKNLHAVAQIKIRGKTQTRYYLMSSADGPGTIEAIRGKAISGTTVHDANFVARVVMQDKLGLAKELVLKTKKLGLRGVRDVIRGKSSAVLLEEVQYEAIKGTPFEKKLQLIFRSVPLPNPPIAVDKRRINAATIKKLERILHSMSSDPNGQKLLTTFGIDAFVSPEPKAWEELVGMMKK